MDLDTAKQQFNSLFKNFATESDRTAFFEWLGKEVVVPNLESNSSLLSSIPENEAGVCNGNQTKYTRLEATAMLKEIADTLREQLPVEAVLPSESIIHPVKGEDAGLNSTNCVHVDSFLYDEDGEEALVQEGKLDRAYCLDCGSRNTEELTYITHSCSKERLQFIFCDLLPNLAGKTVVDIGSRLGAVLYGAYYYSQASKIIGIEINSDFCQLQKKTVKQFGLNDRVCILEGDMLGLANIIKSSNVVVLNNVFSWFLPEKQQVKMWKCLYSCITPGTMVVTIPALETSLESLSTGIDLSTWVKQMACGYTPDGDDNSQMELSEIKLYRVLPRTS